MLELSLNKIMKHMGTNLILDGLNINIYEEDRVGIIGANGCGKSTILKMIAGIEPLNLYPGSWSPGYDFGWIGRPENASIAYLDQEPSFLKGATVLQVLESSFQELEAIEIEMRQLEKQMAEATDQSLEKILKAYSILLEKYEAGDGYAAKEKLKKICSGFKFDAAFLEQKFEDLSGGEQTTVALGKLLIDTPDILLLDEPTNHLDTKKILWLEAYLKTYKGIVILVSHDRYFLDAVTNKTIEIEFKKAKTYSGNYSSFKRQKDENLRVQYDQYREQQKAIKQYKLQIRELREWAQKADSKKFYQRARSIQIKLDKMILIPKPIFKPKNMRIDLKQGQRSGKEVVLAKKIYKSFADKQLIESSNFMIEYGDRVALLGRNGSGKSTLIKMMLGNETVDRGELILGASTQVAYLPQSIEFENEDHSVLDCFRDDQVIEEGAAREYLARFMFYGEAVYTQVKGLSGGERIRLELARILYKPVNFLILDEPTNHLDINTIENMETLLEDYSGTILFVSHDRYFTKKISKKILAVENKAVIEYCNGYENYLDQVERANQGLEVHVDHKILALKSTKKKNEDLIKEIKIVEEELTMIENKMIEIDMLMSAAGSDYQKLATLNEEKQLELATSTSKWRLLDELLDRVEG